MTYLVRPATDEEREAVACSWRTLLKLPKGERDDAGQLLVPIGHFDLARDFLRIALNDAIDTALDRCTVLVADHPDAPGFPLGWVAFERGHAGPLARATDPRRLLALHVQANSRKAWVGRTLLRHVLDLLGPDTPCALMTAAGRRLLGHVRASMGRVAA